MKLEEKTMAQSAERAGAAGKPQFSLEIRTGAEDGRLFQMTTPFVRIGRQIAISEEDSEANVASFTIRTDKSISREHCQLSVKSREWLLLEDLESRFGTHLNGARIESPTLCKTGDLVRIGDTEILIR